MRWRIGATVWRLMLVVVIGQLGCGGATSSKMTELQRLKSGPLDIVLLSPSDALHHGKDTFTLEVWSNGNLVDVGMVRATASMPMPGAAMFGTVDVERGDVPGRYSAKSQFDM